MVINSKHITISAVILDFDGVLVESNEEKTRAFQDLFSQYPDYSQAMMDFHLSHQSSPRMVKFRHYASQLLKLKDEAAGAEAEHMALRFAALVKNRVIHCPEVPGADRFLQTFAGRIPLFISSNTPAGELGEILVARGIDGYIKGVFGNPPTSKPDAIRSVLESEALPAHACLFIGDAMSDYQAAADTGLGFMGRYSGLPFTSIEAPIYQDMHGVTDALLKLILP